MIVYVETNFVLELALLQGQHRQCRDIMGLCERGAARLVVPVFSIVEPLTTTFRQHKERTALNKKLADEVRQLARTESYQEKASLVEEIAALMVRSVDEEQSRLDEVLRRLLGCAETIPLNATVLTLAAKCREAYDMHPQDSIVAASVLHHLETESLAASCFLNKDTKHFSASDVDLRHLSDEVDQGPALLQHEGVDHNPVLYSPSTVCRYSPSASAMSDSFAAAKTSRLAASLR